MTLAHSRHLKSGDLLCETYSLCPYVRVPEGTVIFKITMSISQRALV